MLDRRGVLLAAGAGAVLARAGAASAASAADIPPIRTATAAKLTAMAPMVGAQGISLSIAKHGAPVGFWSQGYASIPFQVPIGPKTLFHTGSNGKHVTALGILQLAEAGQLSLDEPVGRFVKDLPEAWAGRPLRALLSHTSGIPDYEDALEWDRPLDRAAFIKIAGARPMDFEPGESWSYSNTGYVLLGWALEAVSGLSYIDYIKTRLFAPAGLPDARPDAAQEIIANRAEPYDTVDGRIRHAVMMENGVSAMPDGGLLFSARDTAPWGAALSGSRLVSPASMAQAFHPTRLKTGRDAPYGFGWFTDSTRGRDVQHHGGAVPGFISMFARLPAHGLTMVVLTNGSASSAVLLDMAMLAAEAVAPGSTWMSLQPGDGSDARSRKLLALLAPGKDNPDPAAFGEEIRIRLAKSPSGAGVIPRSQVRLTGLAPVEDYAVAGGRLVRYRIANKVRTIHRLVGWTDDDRIFWI